MTTTILDQNVEKQKQGSGKILKISLTPTFLVGIIVERNFFTVKANTLKTEQEIKNKYIKNNVDMFAF